MKHIRKITGVIVKYTETLNPNIFAAAIFFLFFILPFLAIKAGTMEGDMAEYLNNPLRIIHGELPYREFWLLFPPGEVLFPALVYKLFGLNINLVLLISIVFSSLCGLLTFIIGRKLTGSNIFATLLAFMVYYDGLIRYYYGPAYDHLDFFFLLVATLFYLEYLSKKQGLFLFLVGISVGMAFFFRLYEVGPAAIAFLVSLYFNSRYNRKTVSFITKEILFYLSGIVLPLIIITFFLFDIWRPMFFGVIVDSISHGTSMKIPFYHESFEAFNRVKEILLSGRKTSIIALAGGLIYSCIALLKDVTASLTPFIVVICSAWYLIRKKFDGHEMTIVLLFLTWGILSLPKALGRSDLMHLASSTTPLFFVIIMLLQKSMHLKNSIKLRGDKLVSITLVILCCFSLLSFTSYVKNTYDLVKNNKFEVKSGTGQLFFNNSEDACNANKVIWYIIQNTGPGDYIFVTPWFAPPFYALTNRKDPTYYDSLIDVVARPSEDKQNSICNGLSRKKTKLIIHNTQWGFDDKEELQFSYSCKVLQRFIDSNYKLVEQFGRYGIYVPK